MKLLKSKVPFSLSIEGSNFKIKKNEYFIVPDWFVALMYNQNKDNFNKAQKVSDVEESFSYFNAQKDKNSKAIMIRSGGIGDLVALSSLAYRIYDITKKSVIFITQHKYFDLFSTIMYDFIRPAKFLEKLNISSNNFDFYKLVYFEGVIENSTKNQYEIMFEKINYQFSPEFGRPKLDINKAKKMKRNIYLDEKTFNILINPKSTSIIRTMPVKDIYIALREAFDNKLSNVKFYVHEINLKEPDIEFIKKENPNIVVISKKECPNLASYISDVYYFDYIVSVDSAAVHIREGLEKPGLGIYASFPVEARTKYYKYMTTVDLPKKCNNQPCFIHTKHPLETCKTAEELHKNGQYPKEYKEAYSPCHTSLYNPDIIDFLIENIKSNALKYI